MSLDQDPRLTYFLPATAHHRFLERAGLRSQFQLLRQGFLRNRLRNKKPSSRPPRTDTADRGTGEGSVPTLAIVVETFSNCAFVPLASRARFDQSSLHVAVSLAGIHPRFARADARPRRYAASRPFHPTDTPRNAENQKTKNPGKGCRGCGVFWRVRRRSTRALGRGLL